MCHKTPTKHSAKGAPHTGGDGTVEDGVETGTEGAGAGGGADQFLQHHVPADDEGHHLPDGDVAVHVGASGRVGHPHPELGVAYTCWPTGTQLRLVLWNKNAGEAGTLDHLPAEPHSPSSESRRTHGQSGSSPQG